ncbi:MAG: tRNA 2-thiouridine(34) synthase MnmA [bacterium]
MAERGRSKLKVGVAMSGGVDSSMAAALLKKGGYDVVGFTLKLFDEFDPRPGYRGCCSLESVEDARRVAHVIGIPFYVLNYKKKFMEKVIEPFCESYLRGETPNPCVECNRWIKFKFLLEQMESLDIDRTATGHYALKKYDDEKKIHRLYRAADRAKDQSYFLYMLTQKNLNRILFPNGRYRKSALRAMAAALGLPVAEKPESQDVCFALDESYVELIEKKYAGRIRTGKIKTADGRVLGEHRGIHRYTVGQRKGLRVSAGKPLYVTRIDTESGAVFVGGASDALRGSFTCVDVSFVHDPPPDGAEVQVKARYQSPFAAARLFSAGGNSVLVRLEKPLRAVAPGQSAVFYGGDELLGGGIIQPDAG